MRPPGIIDLPNAHVVDWLWRDGVTRNAGNPLMGMEAHKAQFVEQTPWFCVLGVYQAWRHTKDLRVVSALPVPF